MCMCLCVFACVFVCMCTCICAGSSVCDMCVSCVRVFVQVCLCVYVCVLVRVWLCVFVRVCVWCVCFWMIVLSCHTCINVVGIPSKRSEHYQHF